MSERQTFDPNVYYDSSQPRVYYSGILKKTRKETCGCLGTQHPMSALLEGVYVGGVEGTVIPSRQTSTRLLGGPLPFPLFMGVSYPNMSPPLPY